ncbi:MAG TPA: DUF92 domain-containing protein [Bacteroidota bacterium]|nr:DUF92 domain-containing protein [Bacteroidota bacterium]
MVHQFIVAVFLAFAVAAASWRFRFLSVSGSVATFFLATVIFGIGGFQYAVPVLTFFISSSLLSKYGRKRKEQFQTLFEKTDRRDAGQVFANGGLAGILTVSSLLFSPQQCYLLYLSSLAAVTADTWGTELGLLARNVPRSIITLKTVNAGTSGAVSLPGLAGGLLGAAVIALSGIYWLPSASIPHTLTVILFSGLIGSLIDSLLGATIQAQYTCEVCGKKTEKKIHCAKPSALISGYLWITNDFVNWCCALSGCLCCLLFNH